MEQPEEGPGQVAREPRRVGWVRQWLSTVCNNLGCFFLVIGFYAEPEKTSSDTPLWFEHWSQLRLIEEYPDGDEVGSAPEIGGDRPERASTQKAKERRLGIPEYEEHG